MVVVTDRAREPDLVAGLARSVSRSEEATCTVKARGAFRS